MVDGHCCKLKSIHNGSVLSPTLFLLFINDLLSIKNCHLYSHADDSTLEDCVELIGGEIEFLRH